jgi:hypothetical protein
MLAKNCWTNSAVQFHITKQMHMILTIKYIHMIHFNQVMVQVNHVIQIPKP